MFKKWLIARLLPEEQRRADAAEARAALVEKWREDMATELRELVRETNRNGPLPTRAELERDLISRSQRAANEHFMKIGTVRVQAQRLLERMS